MRAPELLDPAASDWTISAEPLADILADLDPADLLLALPVPTGGVPPTGATAKALSLVGLDAAEVRATHEPSSEAGSVTTIPLPPGERPARKVLLVGVGAAAATDLRAAGAALGH